MKKCLTTLLLLCALLLALPALAEDAASPTDVTLPAEPVLSREVECLQAAARALNEKYDLTIAALGLFDATVELCGDSAIVIFVGDTVPERLTGTYYVVISPAGVQALWTYEGVEAHWQSGDLSSPVWGMRQLQKYLNTGSMERYELFTPYFDVPDGYVYPLIIEADRTARDAARALATRAVAVVYGLDEGSLYTEADIYELHSYSDGHTEWEVMVYLASGPEEVSFYVTIHGETGVILDIDVISGGIG